MMAAGIFAYGVSLSLNIWLFERLRAAAGKSRRARVHCRRTVADRGRAYLHRSFVLRGAPHRRTDGRADDRQAGASAVMVPLVIAMVVRIGRRLDLASSRA